MENRNTELSKTILFRPCALFGWVTGGAYGFSRDEVVAHADTGARSPSRGQLIAVPPSFFHVVPLAPPAAALHELCGLKSSLSVEKGYARAVIQVSICPFLCLVFYLVARASLVSSFPVVSPSRGLRTDSSPSHPRTTRYQPLINPLAEAVPRPANTL